MARLKEFLQEENGNLSSTRLVFLCWAFVTLGVWGYLSVSKGALQTPPWEIVGILFTFGAVKTVQKYGENKPPQGG